MVITSADYVPLFRVASGLVNNDEDAEAPAQEGPRRLLGARRAHVGTAQYTEDDHQLGIPISKSFNDHLSQYYE